MGMWPMRRPGLGAGAGRDHLVIGEERAVEHHAGRALQAVRQRGVIIAQPGM
jgi:hypothetical protein